MTAPSKLALFRQRNPEPPVLTIVPVPVVALPPPLLPPPALDTETKSAQTYPFLPPQTTGNQSFRRVPRSSTLEPSASVVITSPSVEARLRQRTPSPLVPLMVPVPTTSAIITMSSDSSSSVSSKSPTESPTASPLVSSATSVAVPMKSEWTNPARPSQTIGCHPSTGSPVSW